MTTPSNRHNTPASSREPKEMIGGLPLRTTDPATFLIDAAAWVDAALPHYLPRGEPANFLYDLAGDYPARGGKRFRPALLLLCASLVGAEPRQGLPTAVALELFQNFALVHDDIEDGSLMRRGRPALHRLHGVPLAINAGDLLFGLVHEALADNEALLGAEMAWAVSRRCAEVFRRTFEGQAMDIGWIRANHLPSRAEFEEMIRLKTGWYSGRGPCQLGAFIGGGEGASVSALGDFGESLGIGFQLRDDLLNLTADSADTAPVAQSGGYGKERGGDIVEGKRTLIVIEMLERLPPGEGSRLREVLIHPPGKTREEDVAWAIEKAETSGALDAVRRRCVELGRKAEAALAPLPESPERALLAELAQWLAVDRAT